MSPLITPKHSKSCSETADWSKLGCKNEWAYLHLFLQSFFIHHMGHINDVCIIWKCLGNHTWQRSRWFTWWKVCTCFQAFIRMVFLGTSERNASWLFYQLGRYSCMWWQQYWTPDLTNWAHTSDFAAGQVAWYQNVSSHHWSLLCPGGVLTLHTGLWSPNRGSYIHTDLWKVNYLDPWSYTKSWPPDTICRPLVICFRWVQNLLKTSMCCIFCLFHVLTQHKLANICILS